MTQVRRWHIYPSIDAMVRHAAEAVTRCAEQTIGRRGRFDIVLAGGDTPRAVYQRLRGADTDWRAWHVYFGDERCVPRKDRERNDRMVYDVWLSGTAVPPQQVHVMPAERGADEGAAAYADVVKSVDFFDLVLLGLGEDGHTASLFPDHDLGVLPGGADVLAVHGAPKPPSERVTLSAKRLSRAAQVIFLVTGAAKAKAVSSWWRGEDIPARHITPVAGVDILVDMDVFPLGDPGHCAD